MSIAKKTAIILQDAKINIKIILSALWAARMFSSLQGDSTRFHDPVALKELVEGTGQITVTNEMLLIMSMILAVPIFMSFLSLTLKDKVNRWTNIIIGMFFVVWELVFLIFVYPQGPIYEMFWGIAYLVFVALVVWYAWKWPKQKV